MDISHALWPNQRASIPPHQAVLVEARAAMQQGVEQQHRSLAGQAGTQGVKQGCTERKRWVMGL